MNTGGVYVPKCDLYSCFGGIPDRRSNGWTKRKSSESTSCRCFIHAADSISDGFAHAMPVAGRSGKTMPDSVADAESLADDEALA